MKDKKEGELRIQGQAQLGIFREVSTDIEKGVFSKFVQKLYQNEKVKAKKIMKGKIPLLADEGFSQREGGANPPNLGAPTYDLSKFFRKLHE